MKLKRQQLSFNTCNSGVIIIDGLTFSLAFSMSLNFTATFDKQT